jgi:hypothetical protein
MGWGDSSVGEISFGMHKTPGSISSTGKKQEGIKIGSF